MSRNARTELDWADGTFSFALRWGELAELQEKCDAGPYRVLDRLQGGDWRIEDISNVIRLGLIGGGMLPADALKKVRFYVEDRPPMENLFVAIGVLTASIIGAPDEPLGEPDAAKQNGSQSTTSQTEKSASPPSMEPAAPSVSRRRKSKQ